MNLKKLFATTSIISGLTLGACTMWSSIIAEHEAACKAQARVIIHNKKLWEEYKLASEKSFRSRRARFGPETERAVIEGDYSFEQRFGSDLTIGRSYPTDKVMQNDIYLIKNGIVVAQYVDFIVKLEGLSGGTGLDCVSLFPALYGKEEFTK